MISGWAFDPSFCGLLLQVELCAFYITKRMFDGDQNLMRQLDKCGP